MQLTFEQHAFELHESTYTGIFFFFLSFFEKYAVGHQYLWISHPPIQPTKGQYFSLRWGNCRCRGPTICTVHAISHKELEHFWILVSEEVLEPISHVCQGMTKCLGSQKLYADF